MNDKHIIFLPNIAAKGLSFDRFCELTESTQHVFALGYQVTVAMLSRLARIRGISEK